MASQDEKHGNNNAMKEPEMAIESKEVGATSVSEVDDQHDEVSDKALVWQIDRWLMPFMMFTQMLQNVDSTALGYAAVWNMNRDLKLSTNEYTWIASMLFLGYLCFEWMMGLIAQHWHTGRVVGGVVVLWGLTMMAAALTTSFGGLAAQRFVLGALQSVITPAWVLISSIFYRKAEQTFRIVFWWSMNGVSLSFGGLVSYACGHIHVGNMGAWRWLFIVEGAVTTLWGIVVFLIFPSSPQTARWLKPHEKDRAVQRLAGNKTGTRNPEIKKYQILEALDPRKDPQGLLLMALIFFNEFVNGGFGVFYALTLKDLGYSNLQTSLLGIALGAAQVFWMVGAASFTLRYKNIRIIMALLALIPAFIGFLLQLVLPAGHFKALKTVAVCLALGYCATCALSFQLPAQNAGGFSKRTTMTSMAFLGYSLGNIIGPHVFYEGQHPRYLTGYVIDLCCFVIQAIILLFMRWWYIKENRKRDELYGPPQADLEDATTDLTDQENHNFRYSY